MSEGVSVLGNSVVICTGANACGKVKETLDLGFLQLNFNVLQSVYLKQVRFTARMFSENFGPQFFAIPGILGYPKAALIQLMAQVGFLFSYYIFTSG
jgi:hypothetical protein